METETATSETLKFGGLPESPRSVSGNSGKSPNGQTSNGLLLKSKIEEIRQKGFKTDKNARGKDENENLDDSKPFTVVRVSSSVSQVS